MYYLYVMFAVFVAFVIFQTLYLIVPLFKNEKKHEIPIIHNYSFSIIVPA